MVLIDSGSPLWEGYHESRGCSRDTYPESHITKYTSIRRLKACLVQSGRRRGSVEAREPLCHGATHYRGTSLIRNRPPPRTTIGP